MSPLPQHRPSTIRRRSVLPLLVIFILLTSFRLTPAFGTGQPQAETLATTFAITPTQMSGFTATPDGLELTTWQGTFESQPFTADFEFIAVGATWDNPLPDGIMPQLRVRVQNAAGTWGEWVELPLLSDDRPDNAPLTATELLFTEGRTVQVRGQVQNPDGADFVWQGLELVVIDGRPGPTALELAASRPDTAPTDGPYVISRASWGANESYRFDSQGNEIWPVEYYSLRALFVHHTASSPTTDPAAAVRSIYYYHAVTNGWGDIGYHYLVDQYGNLYQGRWGTEANGLVAEGGHALGYNRNTMAVSFIGNFANSNPPANQMQSAKEILAWRAATYGIDPYASVWLDGQGTNPDRTFPDSLMGHRDSHTPPRTTCPGNALYARLPEIRQDVSNLIPTIAVPPIVQMTAPYEGQVLEGNVEWRSDGSPNVTRVEYQLDGSLIAMTDAAPWAVTVDSASLPAGEHTVRVTAYTALGLSSSDERTITVSTVSPIAGTRPPTTTTRENLVYLPIILRPEPPLICTEQISNGAFDTNTDWRLLLGTYAARYVNEQAITSRSLRVGMAPSDNVEGFSSARIPFTLPTVAESMTLTMSYLPQSGANAGADGQYIGLLDSEGNYIYSLIPYGQMQNSTEWLPLSFDLSAYAGQTLYLYVGTRNDGEGGTTRLYVDDVRVQTCAR